MTFSKIQWSKGFFRLWVVLSVLWLAFVTAINWEHFPDESGYAYRIGVSDEVKTTISEVLKAAEFAKAAGDFPSEKRLLAMTEEPIKLLRERQSQVISQWAIFGISIPMFFFALGLAVAWTFRGFQSQR